MFYLLPFAALFFLGWLVKYRRATWLISGYNIASRKEKETYDVAKLCRHVGNFIFTLAGIFFMMSVTSITFPQYSEQILGIGIGVLIVVIVAGLIYINTGNRVRKE